MLKNTKILILALFFMFPMFFSAEPVYADDCAQLSEAARERCEENHIREDCQSAGTPDNVQRCLDRNNLDNNAADPITTPDGLSLNPNPGQNSIDNNPIVEELRTIIDFLLAGVFILITISVVVAGIQYTTSNGDPQKTQKAVERLTYAGIAIVLYVFGFAILQWILPGGTISL